MDKRLIKFYLIAFPLFVGTFLYQNYVQQAYAPLKVTPTPAAAAATPAGGTSIAPAPGTGALGVTLPGTTSTPTIWVRPTNLSPVKLSTETFEIEFSRAGGVPSAWRIIDPTYTHAKPGDADAKEIKRGIDLIDPELDPHGQDRPLEIVLKEQSGRFYNELNQNVYLPRGPREEGGFQVVEFESPATDAGLKLIKTYRFPKAGFVGSVTLKFINQGQSKLTFNNGDSGLGLTAGPGLGKAPAIQSSYEFTRAVYQSSIGVKESLLKKDKTETITEANSGIEWGGIHSRYFLMALLPRAESMAGKGFGSAQTRLDQRVADVALAAESETVYYPKVELYSAPFSVAPGQSAEFAYDIFAGPKDKAILRAAPIPLDLILFPSSYTWMRALCFFLMWMLGAFNGWIHNWGMAIIGLVLTLRLATFPLTQIGMKQQAKMQQQQARIKPYLDEINEKHKDNPQKKNAEVMRIYREHGINPLGMFKGCIWMFLQLPIFFALYKILSQAIDLRGSSFLWIKDLSQPDQLFHWGVALPFIGQNFNLLPILTSATQMLVTHLSMASNPAAMENPTQKQMMIFMPLGVFFITYQFPAGLVLYWFISNLWQLAQQELVNKRIMKK